MRRFGICLIWFISAAAVLAQRPMPGFVRRPGGHAVDRNRGHGRCRVPSGKFVTYSTKDGLPSNAVRAVAVGQRGDLWIATKKGLVIRKAGKFLVYDSRVADGFEHPVSRRRK
jgi:hypothetical protein